MKRLTILAALKAGMHQRAAELLSAGPPFELEQTGFVRHAVFLGRDTIAFLFEGPDVWWELDDLRADAFHPALQGALGSWEEFIEGKPVVAEEVFFWERRADKRDGGSEGDELGVDR